jgi:mRNA interferase MazF
MKHWTINQSEIVSIHVSYVNSNSGKRRPVLILQDASDYLTFFRLTTKFDNKSYRIQKQYYRIRDWEQTGLKQISYIDIGTVMMMKKIDTNKILPIGHLSVHDIQELNKFIQQYNKNDKT